MYMQESNLHGFNPLKAIGRALGSTGRAILGSVPGVGQIVAPILDAAARQPADKDKAPAVPAGGAAATVANAVSAATQPAPAATTPSVNDMIQALLVKQLTAQPSAPVAMPAPSAPVVVSNAPPAPSPMYAPAPQSQLPAWALPAAIAGAGLLFFMSQKRR